MCYWNAIDRYVLFFSCQLCVIVALSYNSITTAWTAVRRPVSTVFVDSNLRWKSFHQTMVESVWRPLSVLLFTADSVLLSSFKSVPQEKWAIAKSCKISEHPRPFQTCVVVGDTLFPSHSTSNGTLDWHISRYLWKWYSFVTAISHRATLLCRQWLWRSVEMMLFPAGCSWRPWMCPSNNRGLSECTVCWQHRSYKTSRSAWKSLYISNVCELTPQINNFF